jgi:hypothetical protein
MIEILDCAQGSPEWFEARRGLPTASEFKSIMADSRQRKMRTGYLHRLAAELITGEVQPSYQSADMRRGKEWEAEARDLYAFVHEVELQLVGFIRNDVAGYSPDGLIGDDGLLEVKTRNPPLMVEVMATGGCPSEYHAQIQGGLWIAGRQWCDLVCYWPTLPLYVHRVERDELYINELETQVYQFAAELREIVQRIQGGPTAILRDQLERSAAL